MKRLMAVLAILAMAACTDQATAPEQQQAPAVTADFTNNVDNGNVKFYRHNDHYLLCYNDLTNNLRACVGTVPLGGGTDPDCGLQALAEPISIQEIGNKDDNHLNLMGDVWVTIRDRSQSGDCFGQALVAEGWGRMHYTDNDGLGIGPGEHNANAWGLGWQGQGMTPLGAYATFSGMLRFRQNNSTGFRVLAQVVRVSY